MIDEYNKSLKEIDNIAEGEIAIFLSSPDNYSKMLIDVISKVVTEKLMAGIYVSMNRPYDAIKNALGKTIDTNKLFFVDAISGTLGSTDSTADNCIILRSPSALTELSISIANACDTGKLKFLALDSISTMLVYNTTDEIIQFIHYLISQLRKRKIIGLFFGLEESVDKKVIDVLGQLTDKIVRV